jgi:hypothetical protein
MLAARHPYEDALMSKSKKRDGALNSKRRAARDPRDHSRHSQPPAIDWESLNHKPAFSVAEFCARVGISRQTFHNWQTHGIGPHTIKCGGRVLITRQAEAAWLERCATAPPPASLSTPDGSPRRRGRSSIYAPAP